MSHSFDKEYWCLLCVGAMLGTRMTEMEKLWFLSSRSLLFSGEKACEKNNKTTMW